MKTIANLFERLWLPTVVVLTATLWVSGPLSAQVSAGGRPYTFTHPVADTIHSVTMDSVNVAALLAEDAADAERGKHMPRRFGYTIEANLDLDNAGTWTVLPNGDRLWRLRIDARGAYAIILYYKEFWLPDGATFFIYNADRSMVLGAFTSKNNKGHGKFSTGLVKGDASILEYYEPTYVETRRVLR